MIVRCLGTLLGVLVLGVSWVCAQGVITTVAGNGRVFRGDGGPATSAALGLLQGVAVDLAGNVLATDSSNNLVFPAA